MSEQGKVMTYAVLTDVDDPLALDIARMNVFTIATLMEIEETVEPAEMPEQQL